MWNPTFSTHPWSLFEHVWVWEHTMATHCVFGNLLFIRIYSSFLKKMYLLIFERHTERKTLIYCSTYLCIHWLVFVCALTGDWTHNLGISGQCSNQLSYRFKKKNNTLFSLSSLSHFFLPLICYWSALRSNTKEISSLCIKGPQIFDECYIVLFCFVLD